MDHLDERDQLALRIGPVGQVADGPLLDPIGYAVVSRHHARGVGLVAGGDVDPVDSGQGTQHPIAVGRPPAVGGPGAVVGWRGVGAVGTEVGEHVGDLTHHLLTVSDHETVDEIGQRLGIESAVATGDHQRIVRAAPFGTDGHAGQVDQVEDVGIDELGREVEGHHVEVSGRGRALQGEQGNTRPAHGGLHVHPGGIGTLGDGVGPLVQDFVEDLESLVGETDLIGVRIDQQPRQRCGAVLGRSGAELATDVARGLRHLGKQRFGAGPEGLHACTECTRRILGDRGGGRQDGESRPHRVGPSDMPERGIRSVEPSGNAQTTIRRASRATMALTTPTTTTMRGKSTWSICG